MSKIKTSIHNSRMYRYKQKNTEKNLLQFFSVFIFWTRLC